MTTLAKKQILSLAALAGLLVLKSQAQPYYAVGDYNSWANPSATAMSGGPTQYTFAITGCVKSTVNNQEVIQDYAITAVPQSVRHSGNRGFCANSEGEIKYDPAGGTNCVTNLQ